MSWKRWHKVEGKNKEAKTENQKTENQKKFQERKGKKYVRWRNIYGTK